MTKKKLRFGVLPKRQLPTTSHQSSQPTPRLERSVVKEVVETHASTTFHSTFQEFSQRAESENIHYYNIFILQLILLKATV